MPKAIVIESCFYCHFVSINYMCSLTNTKIINLLEINNNCPLPDYKEKEDGE